MVNRIRFALAVSGVLLGVAVVFLWHYIMNENRVFIYEMRDADTLLERVEVVFFPDGFFAKLSADGQSFSYSVPGGLPPNQILREVQEEMIAMGYQLVEETTSTKTKTYYIELVERSKDPRVSRRG